MPGHRCATTQVSPTDLDPSLAAPPVLRSVATQVVAAQLEPVEEAEAPLEEREFAIPAAVWLSTLGRAVARHVRLPRSARMGVAGSQHPRFIVENSPLDLVRAKCEAAGMVLQQPPAPPPHVKGQKRKRPSKNVVHTWKATGPMSAYKFCSVERFKKLGQGSAALMAPGKGRFMSDVLTLAIPPITVKHVQNANGWTAHVDLYLGVFNSQNVFTLPLRANTIYQGQIDPTALFKKMALKVLAEMLLRKMPVSRQFVTLLPESARREARSQALPESDASDSESDSTSTSESEAESGSESE